MRYTGDYAFYLDCPTNTPSVHCVDGRPGGGEIPRSACCPRVSIVSFSHSGVTFYMFKGA